MNKLQLFNPDAEGLFVRRPNRFTVIASAGNSEITAHCANPGRMRELLVPGRRCLFERRSGAARKTAYTLAAVEYGRRIIPLYSAGANRIAAQLVLPRLFPDAPTIRSEFGAGDSRFDFLVSGPEADTLVEVKSCSLVEYGTAMFPDAPTARGTRHVNELLRLQRTGRYRGLVLFVVVNPDARRLVPGIHTDPDFAAAVAAAGKELRMHAVSVSCRETGEIGLANPDLPIDLVPCAAAEKDGGVYLVKITLKSPRTVQVGALGKIRFGAGDYVYVGSAVRNLKKRLARHLRKRKNRHWHIDYLVEAADAVEGFPIRTLKGLECRLARDVAEIAADRVPGFGSSDCRCESHLFLMPPLGPGNEPPLERLLLRYRHQVAL